jgi:hypothetical protein
LSSVSNATGNFLTISGGVVHQRTASETRSDVGAQAQLNGTGFVKASGTTITYDNSTYQVTSDKAQPNGYASLDSNGKVPLTQINDALIGNVNYQGLWNASTNTPTLANPPASGTKGYYYIVSTAGTFAGISFEVGDWIISNGSAWQKVDNTDAVSSVFGRTGNVVAANGDYTTAQVTESGNLYYTDGRARGALSFAAGSGDYNTSTGVITIPTNNNQITNGAGYITSAALSGYVQGSGTAGQVAYWSSGSAITGESNLFWDATNDRLGLNVNTPQDRLDVNGSIRFRLNTPNFFAVNDCGVIDFVPSETDSRVRIAAIGNGGNAASIDFFTGAGGDFARRLRISSTGTVTINNLAGSGTRMVVADANGLLSTQAIGSGAITGSGASGQVAFFTGTSAISSESNLFWDSTNDRLGIGTNTPATTLEVNGVGLFSGGSLVGNTKNGVYIYDTVIASLAGGNSRSLQIQSQTLSIFTGTTYTEKVKVFENGNVVISTSPSDAGFKLDVNGTGRFSGGDGTRVLEVTTGGATFTRVSGSRGNANDLHVANLEFYNSNSTRLVGEIRGITGTGGTQSNSGQLAFYTNNNGTYAERMRIISGGSINFNGIDSTTQYYFGFNRPDSTNLLVNGGNNNKIRLQNIENDVIVLNSNGASFFNSGNVLIGTTTDAGAVFRLQVARTGGSNYLNVITDNNAGYDCAMLFSDGTNQVYAGMMRGSTGLTGAYTIWTGGSARLNVTSGGSVSINNLSGSGNRIVVANSGGTLISAVIGSGLAFDGTTLTATGGSSGSISGSGTSGTIPVFTGTSSIGNSVITQSSGNIGINTASPQDRLDVNGSIRFRANTPNFTSVIDNAVLDYVPTSIFPTTPTIRLAAIGTASVGAEIRFLTGTSSSLDTRITIKSDGNVLIGTQTDNGNRLRVNGTIFSDSSVTATSFFESSDATLKTLVQDDYQAKGIDSVVAKLYIKNGKQELGYFAQDLQGILPSAVSKGSDGLLNLSYREVHTAKIASLENRIKELESQLKNN